MRVQSAEALVMLVGIVLIAACSTAAPTGAPAPSLTAGALTTSEPPAPPADVPTAAGPNRAELPTPQPTVTSPPTATPTQTPTEPLPTTTPTQELPTATPTQSLAVEEIVATLAGLSLEDFFEESYKQLLLRSPRKLTELGLSASYGQRNDRLDDLSDDYIRGTQRLETAILDMLRGFDRDALSSEQQVSYDVYEWYLDNRVRGQEFTYYDYPLNHFVNGYVFRLNELLTELHPLKNRQDAEDYIARLAQVDDQVEQLLEGLALREEIGVIAPDFILRMTKQDILRYLGTSDADPAAIRAPMLPVYTVFSEALLEMNDLSAEERTELRESALEEIRNAFIPAFLDLLSTIDQQMASATDEAGVWKLPNGDAYYAYALRQETSTDLTPEQVHEIGLAEVARIQSEMRAVFDDLGYPQDRSVGEMIQRAIGEGGVYDSSQVVAAYEAILADIDQRVEAVFDVRPRASVVVVGEQGFGGYYTPGTADGSRPAAFHATVGSSGTNKAEMPTTAYHEAIPGHHFQIALTQEMELPTFRKHEFFNGHGEGWALYAERLASELGVYEDDPYGDIGRLRLELLRAARLVVDTGIHAKRWTREQAREYLEENVGGWTHEVERYVAWPAQATGYKIGMIKILELRQQAMEQLGDRFDIKAFHNVVLGNGILPLSILERLVNEYIESEQ